MIQVSINNQWISLPDGVELLAALEQAKVQGPFALAINGEFIPKSRYGEIRLGANAKLDVLSPVGGG